MVWRLVIAGLVSSALAGCLVGPVGGSGGIGSITVENSSPWTIASVADDVFGENGYAPGLASLPDSISFEKEGGAFQNLMWGSYDQTTTVRVTLDIRPIGDTQNYRVVPKLTAVNDAGEAGFESGHPISGLWASEFVPIMREIKKRASFDDA